MDVAGKAANAGFFGYSRRLVRRLGRPRRGVDRGVNRS